MRSTAECVVATKYVCTAESLVVTQYVQYSGEFIGDTICAVQRRV